MESALELLELYLHQINQHTQYTQLYEQLTEEVSKIETL